MEGVTDRIFLSFWAIFRPPPFSPPDNPGNQNFEKLKKIMQI